MGKTEASGGMVDIASINELNFHQKPQGGFQYEDANFFLNLGKVFLGENTPNF